MARATHILQVPVIGQRTGYECGTDHGDMIAAAVKTGALVFAKAGGSGKAALEEVVGFVSRGSTIGYCEVGDREWLRVWYDTDTDAYQLVEHWYMVVNYEGRRFADQIGAGEDHPRSRR